MRQKLQFSSRPQRYRFHDSDRLQKSLIPPAALSKAPTNMRRNLNFLVLGKLVRVPLIIYNFENEPRSRLIGRGERVSTRGELFLDRAPRLPVKSRVEKIVRA